MQTTTFNTHTTFCVGVFSLNGLGTLFGALDLAAELLPFMVVTFLC